MAFMVEDFKDLIDLLAQHPEWRAELRRHVLSDDLIELPALVRQLVEAQARSTSRLDRLEATVQALAEAQARTEARVAELAEAQARAEARLSRIEDHLGHVEGDVLELRYRGLAPAYFGPIARRLRVIDKGRLGDLLDDAIDEGRLTWEDRSAIMLADLVLTGRRRQDGQDVYLLAEISVGVGTSDVERASERAALLAKLGRPVVPIVAGRRINPEAAALADKRGVWYSRNGQIGAPESG
jgi:hypothetical protein